MMSGTLEYLGLGVPPTAAYSVSSEKSPKRPFSCNPDQTTHVGPSSQSLGTQDPQWEWSSDHGITTFGRITLRPLVITSKC